MPIEQYITSWLQVVLVLGAVFLTTSLVIIWIIRKALRDLINSLNELIALMRQSQEKRIFDVLGGTEESQIAKKSVLHPHSFIPYIYRKRGYN